MLHRRVAELMADLGVAREEALEAEIRAAAAQVLADDTWRYLLINSVLLDSKLFTA